MKQLLIIGLQFVVYSVTAQDLHKQLQKNIWYLSGDLLQGGQSVLYFEKPHLFTGYVLFEDSLVHISVPESESVVDCHFELRDMEMKISYSVRYKPAAIDKMVQVNYLVEALGRDLLLRPEYR